MGRIKTTQIKRSTKMLFKLYGDKLGTNFEENKKVVAESAIIPSKKLRNVVAGYATRLAVKAQQSKQ